MLKHLNYCEHSSSDLDVFISACKKNDLEKIKTLNIQNHFLLYAAEFGNLKIFKFLIEEKHININQVNHDNSNILHFASKRNTIDVIGYIIYKLKFDINLPNKWKNTAIHFACAYNDEHVIRFLIKVHQVNLTIDCLSRDILNISVTNNSLNVIKYILTLNEFKYIDFKKYTLNVLHYAASGNSLDVFKYLETHFNTTYKLKNLMKLKCDDNWSYLHYACAYNQDTKLIKYLTKHRLDINDLTNKNENCLHLACENNTQPIIKYLVENYNFNLNDTNRCGVNIVHLSCTNDVNVLEYVTTLVGSQKTLKSTSGGKNIFHFVYSCGTIEMIKFLRTKYPVELQTCIDSGGFSPVHHAATFNTLEVNEFLYSEILNESIQFNIHQLTKNKESLFELSCMQNNISVIEFYDKLEIVFDPIKVVRIICKNKSKNVIKYIFNKHPNLLKYVLESEESSIDFNDLFDTDDNVIELTILKYNTYLIKYFSLKSIKKVINLPEIQIILEYLNIFSLEIIIYILDKKPSCVINYYKWNMKLNNSNYNLILFLLHCDLRLYNKNTLKNSTNSTESIESIKSVDSIFISNLDKRLNYIFTKNIYLNSTESIESIKSVDSIFSSNLDKTLNYIFMKNIDLNSTESIESIKSVDSIFSSNLDKTLNYIFMKNIDLNLKIIRNLKNIYKGHESFFPNIKKNGVTLFEFLYLYDSDYLDDCLNLFDNLEVKKIKKIFQDERFIKDNKIITCNICDIYQKKNSYCLNSECDFFMCNECKDKFKPIPGTKFNFNYVKCNGCLRYNTNMEFDNEEPSIYCFECKKIKNYQSDCREDKETKLTCEDCLTNFKICPSCGVAISKIDGSNHMKYNCEYEFCFKCLSKWNGNHYNCNLIRYYIEATVDSEEYFVPQLFNINEFKNGY